ncbi:ABC transporter ATP-binding protein [Gaoshiqia sp. Z1-71]|uniref:ABC transporter ATP-binding protein n=1 Tax=Gaoshiqia hydrogeniformans TaxID=3290090 RepID=UPI003BF80B84
MIRFKNVSLKLGNKQLLEHFNLTVAKGDKVVFSAPSGSGKTSLLRLILGFIDPDEGKIIFNKKEVKPENLRFIRSQAAYLSQDIDFPNGRVNEVFREIFNYSANKSCNYSEPKLIERLAEVGLPEEILRKNTSDISGGERQRLGWVLIMLLDRPVLLLDEPTSALDDRMKHFFIEQIKNTSKTVICVSHDAEWRLPEMRVISSFYL